MRFRQGRLEDLDEPDGSFDVILGIHVLEHVVDLLAALRSCRRMLAPEGTAYFVTPNADSAGLRLFREAWWMLEDPTHVRFVSVASVPYLAGRTGFARCSVRRLRTDSLMVEAASTARALRCSDPRAGALSSTGVRIAAAGALPATLAWRSIRPSWSPSLEVMLRGVRR